MPVESESALIAVGEKQDPDLADETIVPHEESIHDPGLLSSKRFWFRVYAGLPSA